jgi:uncharacterized protein YdaU (DUF1376 family)
MKADFPASPILDASAEHRLTTLEIGALLTLSEAFWRGKAAPLPASNAQLSRLASVHGRQWCDINKRVMTAWHSLEPKLAAIYAKHAARIAAHSAHAHRLNARRRAMTAAKSAGKMSDPGMAGVPLVPAALDDSKRCVSKISVALSD